MVAGGTRATGASKSNEGGIRIRAIQCKRFRLPRKSLPPSINPPVSTASLFFLSIAHQQQGQSIPPYALPQKKRGGSLLPALKDMFIFKICQIDNINL